MNGFILIIPFLFVRFGLLSLLNKKALTRATLFAPLEGSEKVAYLFYQVSNIAILLLLVFLRIKTNNSLFFIGLFIYTLGIILLTISIINFSKPKINGINTNRIYKISRNPMYVSYFIYFLGCVLLTQSILFFIFLIVFQISSHWIILSEERWCVNKFGDEYKNYINNVRRYF